MAEKKRKIWRARLALAGGWTLAAIGAAGLLGFGFRLVASAAVLVLGLGIVERMRSHPFRPENVAQVAQRLWKVHGYAVREAWQAIEAAQRGAGDLTPREVWERVREAEGIDQDPEDR